MKLKSVAGCILLAGSAGLAVAATVGHHNDEQDRQFLRAVAIEDMTQAHMAEMARNSGSQETVKILAAPSTKRTSTSMAS